jgi:hypothetical protein
MNKKDPPRFLCSEKYTQPLVWAGDGPAELGLDTNGDITCIAPYYFLN